MRVAKNGVRGQPDAMVLLLPLPVASSTAGEGRLITYKLSNTRSSTSPPTPTSPYSFNEEQHRSCDRTMASWENGQEERDAGGYSYSEEAYEQPYSPTGPSR